MDRQAYPTRTPLAESDELSNQMGGLIESTVGGVPRPVMPTWTPLADVTKADDGYQVDVELPGMKTRTSTSRSAARNWLSPERSRDVSAKASCGAAPRHTGRFEYRMLLLGEVNTEGVKAQMSDGVLTATVSMTAALRAVLLRPLRELVGR
ncbi:Hsp20/alpha crystallin family protein [Streptomyces decoyicus]